MTDHLPPPPDDGSLSLPDRDDAAYPPVPAPNASYSSARTGYYGYGGGHVPESDIHLLSLLRTVYKRRWTAIAAFVLVLGSVTLYTFTAIPIYQSTVQILIETENPNVVKFEEVYNPNKQTNDYYQTQYRILESRLLARRTLDTEKLWNHPLLVPAAESGLRLNPIALLRAAAGGIGGLFQSREQTEPADASETAIQSMTIDTFLGGLSVSPVRNSRLVEIAYRSPDPYFASRVANAIAREYIRQSLEFKYQATEEATNFLKDRMKEQRQSLEQSELALQKYREQTESVSLEERQNIVVQRLSDLNSAVTKARTERIQREAAWNQIHSIENDRAALDTHPLVLSNPFIQQLKGEQAQLQKQEAELSDRLGDRHPEMLKVRSQLASSGAKLQAEITKVVQSIRNDYESALAQERSLTVALNDQKSEALALNRKAIEYGVLQRDTATNRQIFDGLLQRSKETGIQGELQSSNIRVVDPAEVPRAPASPNKTNNLLFGLFGGAVFGIGLAFLFEYLDSRIKTPDEIKQHLGVPFLGIVPALDTKALAGRPLAGDGGVPHQFAEAFRTVRTNVLFSSADAGSKSIVVTSTIPGEGKTVVTANLALSLAASGQRVLLIDADMRRPKTHELFDLPQEPGLSNVLVGNAEAQRTIQRTNISGLWVLTAGRNPPNPAELLGSRHFKDFLASLADYFDWVIIDSPPVMAVTDASVIAHRASGVVFVVGCEMTSRAAAKAAIEQLNSARVKHVGAVLNRVDLQKNAYYYSTYYSHSYAGYYTQRAG